jgi:hypothetical protein
MKFLVNFALFGCFLFSACEPRSDSGIPVSEPVGVRRNYATDILIFNGDGTVAADASALEALVIEAGNSYDKVISSELNAMTQEQLRQYGLILWPGGNSPVT